MFSARTWRERERWIPEREIAAAIKQGDSRTLYENALRAPDSVVYYVNKEGLFNELLRCADTETFKILRGYDLRGFHETSLIWAVTLKRPDAVDYLLSTPGVKPGLEKVSILGKSVAELAIANNSIDILILLLQNYSLEDLTNCRNQTPIHVACQTGSVEALRVILAQLSGPETLNQKDDYGLTPLMYAVLSRNPEIVQLLLEHGSEITHTIWIPHKVDEDLFEKSQLHRQFRECFEKASRSSLVNNLRAQARFLGRINLNPLETAYALQDIDTFEKILEYLPRSNWETLLCNVMADLTPQVPNPDLLGRLNAFPNPVLQIPGDQHATLATKKRFAEAILKYLDQDNLGCALPPDRTTAFLCAAFGKKESVDFLVQYLNGIDRESRDLVLLELIQVARDCNNIEVFVELLNRFQGHPCLQCLSPVGQDFLEIQFFEPLFFFTYPAPEGKATQSQGFDLHAEQTTQTAGFWDVYYSASNDPAEFRKQLDAVCANIFRDICLTIFDCANTQEPYRHIFNLHRLIPLFEDRSKANILLVRNTFGLNVIQAIMIRSAYVLSFMRSNRRDFRGSPSHTFLDRLNSSRYIPNRCKSHHILPFMFMFTNGLIEFLEGSRSTKSFFSLHRPNDQPYNTLFDMVHDISQFFVLPYVLVTLGKESSENLKKIKSISEFNLKTVIDFEWLYFITTLLLSSRFSWNGAIRLNNAWHRFQIPISARPLVVLDSWYELFPSTRIEGIYEIVCLTDSNQLREEGILMNHCVGSGSYASSCASGDTHIISIRRHNKNGSVERLATVKLVYDRYRSKGFPWVVSEFRGQANQRPPDCAERIWQKFLNLVKTGHVAISDKRGAVIVGNNGSSISAAERLTRFPLSGDLQDLLEGYRLLRIRNGDGSFVSFIPDEADDDYQKFFQILNFAKNVVKKRLHNKLP